MMHCYVGRCRSGACQSTDADILWSNEHWGFLTSRGWKGLIEHIMQCMYNLYGPSWGPVTTFGYVITDSRIYPPPSPSRRPTPPRASPNQNVAGTHDTARAPGPDG